MQLKNLRIYLLALLAPTMFLLFPVNSFAATASSLLCGSSNQNLSTIEDITSKYIPAGKAYLKLNYQSSPIDLSLYINNYAASQCSYIGHVSTNSNTWVSIGNISNSSNDIIIQGLGVGAAPYQAAVELLIVPNNQCVPTTACNVVYNGLSGILQLDDSNILSGAADQIAIYGLKPISSVPVNSVNYYADNQKNLVYTGTTLRPFDRNYLDGGIHTAQLQIKLANNQSIYVNQTINMGIDWTGSLYLKSLIYRNSGSAAVFIVVGISVLLLLIILALLRFIYKRRQANRFHGLDSYHAPNSPEMNNDDDIFVSHDL